MTLGAAVRQRQIVAECAAREHRAHDVDEQAEPVAFVAAVVDPETTERQERAFERFFRLHGFLTVRVDRPARVERFFLALIDFELAAGDGGRREV